MRSHMIIHYSKKSCKIIKQEGVSEFVKRLKQEDAIQITKKIIFNAGNAILLFILKSKVRLFLFHTYMNKFINSVKYDDPPDPYKTIRIDSNKIEYKIVPDDQGNKLYSKAITGGLCQIKNGEGDGPRYRKRINELPRIVGLQERFEENMNWEDTQYYDWFQKKYIENNKYDAEGFDTPEDCFTALCQKYEDLYSKMNNEGYVPGHQGTHRDEHSGNVYGNLEILVCIGRDGNIYLKSGHHRLGIARILGINISAHVLCRHEHWQELRDEIYNNGFCEENEDLKDHPDLQDIVD